MPQPMHWQVPSWKPCGGMFTFARIHDSATRKLVARGRVPLESPAKYSIQRLCSLNLWNQYFAATSLAQPIDFKDREKTKGEWVPPCRSAITSWHRNPAIATSQCVSSSYRRPPSGNRRHTRTCSHHSDPAPTSCSPPSAASSSARPSHRQEPTRAASSSPAYHSPAARRNADR